MDSNRAEWRAWVSNWDQRDRHGKLSQKYGTRSLEEVTQDYLKANPHCTGEAGAESALAAAPTLERAKMSVKEKAAYIAEHGQKYLALPYTKVAKK